MFILETLIKLVFYQMNYVFVSAINSNIIF